MISMIRAFSSLEPALKRIFSIRRALRFVWNSSRGWTTVSVALMLIEGLLPVFALYVLKLMLDAVTVALQPARDPGAFRNVLWYIALAGSVMLLTNLARTLGGLVTHAQGRAVVDHMFDLLHAKSIEVDLEYYENARYYDTMHRAQEEASYRPVVIVNSLTILLRSTVSLAGIVVLLLTFHWAVAPMLLLAVAPGILVRLKFSHETYRLQKRYTADERRAWYFHRMMTTADYAKEIRIFDLGPIFNREYQKIRSLLREVRLRLDLRHSSLELAAQVIATAAVFGSYALIAYRAFLGLTSLGGFVMFYQAFQRGQGFLNEFMNAIATLYESSLFLSNLYEFLDLNRKVVEPSAPVAVPRPIRQGISFTGVSFRYPNSEREVLKDIHLTIRPGEVLALVGENGSGKTTLVKLLCRLYDPTSGEITVDGTNLQQFRTQELRKEISAIFQDYAHYNLSARENIWFGNVSQPPDEACIAAAARRAGADAVIASLKSGYDTILGKLFEAGEELSIGQWQKIALARAFLRDAQVIVLDEPTSALDAGAEYEVFRKFRQLVEGKTALLITHRLSTVRMADRILVLQDGQIAECGTHDQLMGLSGIYARMYQIQAQQYAGQKLATP